MNARTDGRFEEIGWYHSIDLGNGVVTDGSDRTAPKLRRLHLPDSLAGKSVLDVGAWDGFFSFEAERRGAARVLASDWYCWGGVKDRKAGFLYAREALGSQVEDRTIDVLDLSPETVGVFDVVLFLGVLYHMKHPLLALERIASVAGDLVVIETEVAHLPTRHPAVRYYLEGDDWCAPNVAALRAMLADVGFSRVEVVDRYSLGARIARQAKWLVEGRGWGALSRGRVVVHARR